MSQRKLCHGHHIAKVLQESILGNIDEAIKRLIKSGKHSKGPTARDLLELVKKAAQFNIFTNLKGKAYRQFCNFQRDR